MGPDLIDLGGGVLIAVAMVLVAEVDIQSSLDCARAWKIDRTESSAVRDLTLWPHGGMDPVRYCIANELRIGNRSLYKTSKESRDTSLHNASHFYQGPLAAADMLIDIP